MGETSIEWADYTFNPWIGCAKVSPGCKHCYAEVDTYSRVSKARGLPLWGVDAARHRTGEANWKKPLAWNRKAKERREAAEVAARTWGSKAAPYQRPRVFCASLADVFEGRADLDPWRAELWELIERCTELDWLLLTKRPENVLGRVPGTWLPFETFGVKREWSRHVWIGTTVEDRDALERIDILRNVPAAVRFLSIEPLLEDLGELDLTGISWVIVGGESGPKARPMHPDWVLAIRGQCVAAGVPFFFKQWGAHEPDERMFWDYQWWVNKARGWIGGTKAVCIDKLGRPMNIGADFMRARDEGTFPVSIHYPAGKKAAGRILDGRTWDEVPR